MMSSAVSSPLTAFLAISTSFLFLAPRSALMRVSTSMAFLLASTVLIVSAFSSMSSSSLVFSLPISSRMRLMMVSIVSTSSSGAIVLSCPRDTCISKRNASPRASIPSQSLLPVSRMTVLPSSVFDSSAILMSSYLPVSKVSYITHRMPMSSMNIPMSTLSGSGVILLFGVSL